MTMMLLMGYVGPGAGLGFVGSLLAILAVIAVGLMGLVLYPLKLIFTRQRTRSTDPAPKNLVRPKTAATGS